MRYLGIGCAAQLLWASALWAQCGIPQASASSAGWSVQQVNGDWFASNPEYPGLQAEIFMNTPEHPQILDWGMPERYQGRIGVLQYYAGEPGTSYLVTIISNAVIDLETGAVLGEASFSEDCKRMDWHWYDDKVVVEGSDLGEAVINLP